MSARASSNPSARRASRVRRVGTSEARAAWLLVTPAVLALVVVRIVPMVQGVARSFHAPTAGGTKTTLGFGNYSFLFNDFPEFYKSIVTTVLLVVMTVVLQTALATAMALLLVRASKLNAVARTLLLLPLAAPIAASTAVWGILLLPNGPVNAIAKAIGLHPQPFLTSSNQALYCVVVILTWGLAGYWMTILVAGLNDIPRDLYEAAAIDAASRSRTFWQLTLPLLRRPLMFVVVASTIVNFLAFAPSQILTSGGPEGSTNVVMYEIYSQAFGNQDFGLASAEITLCLIVLGALVAAQFKLLGRADA